MARPAVAASADDAATIPRRASTRLPVGGAGADAGPVFPQEDASTSINTAPRDRMWRRMACRGSSSIGAGRIYKRRAHVEIAETDAKVIRCRVLGRIDHATPINRNPPDGLRARGPFVHDGCRAVDNRAAKTRDRITYARERPAGRARAGHVAAGHQRAGVVSRRVQG